LYVQDERKFPVRIWEVRTKFRGEIRVKISGVSDANGYVGKLLFVDDICT